MSISAGWATEQEHVGLLLMRAAEQHKALMKLEEELLSLEEAFATVTTWLGEATSPDTPTDLAALFKALDALDIQRLKATIKLRERLAGQLRETRSKLNRSGISLPVKRTKRRSSY